MGPLAAEINQGNLSRLKLPPKPHLDRIRRLVQGEARISALDTVENNFRRRPD